MKVLLLGSGGRESALAWGLGRSTSVTELVAAPGNPGIARLAEIAQADIGDPDSVVALARRVGADLVVVGPESPLVAGVGDALRAAGVSVFGPDAAAARIEASKTYAKSIMAEAGVPTARARSTRSVPEAVAFLDELGPPYVVKADGLADGKGVSVSSDRATAIAAIEERLVGGVFGEAGHRVVIEEYLEGQEASLIAFTDGDTVLTCEPAQDYKRALDDDQGPNTGGMGSYSPVPWCPPEAAEHIVEAVLEPVIAQLAQLGVPFVGALYAGVVLGPEPKVIEFNARFGDPETQALVPRLQSDLGELCGACAARDLEGMHLEWRPEVCVAVVLASAGYPGPHRTGVPVQGVDEAASLSDVQVFHAGTALTDEGLVTAGGRVLSVSALGRSFDDARGRAYEACSHIRWPGLQMRSDIAARAAEAESLMRSVAAHPASSQEASRDPGPGWEVTE